MFLFEATALGQNFVVIRLLLDIPGIIIIALLINVMTSKKEVLEIYKKAEQS
jgi:hypothetical protein